MPNTENQSNQESSRFTNGNFAQEQQKFTPEVPSDDDEAAGEIRATEGLSRAEAQVRENEDASLQDDTYTFDSDNTDSGDEGIHEFGSEDVGGGMSDYDADFDVNNSDY
jgi:hypothetical protein